MQRIFFPQTVWGNLALLMVLGIVFIAGARGGIIDGLFGAVLWYGLFVVVRAVVFSLQPQPHPSPRPPQDEPGSA